MLVVSYTPFVGNSFTLTQGVGGNRSHGGPDAVARNSYNRHFYYSHDFDLTEGEVVVASSNGVVIDTYTLAENLPPGITKTEDARANEIEKSKGDHGLGNTVTVLYENGVYVSYSHLAPGSISVDDGDRIVAGQTLGEVGRTGYIDGVHLHYTFGTKINDSPDMNNKVKIADGRYGEGGLNVSFDYGTNGSVASSFSDRYTGKFNGDVVFSRVELDGVWIEGSAENDFIDGSGGNDYLAGHDGHDYLTGRGGNDELRGHSGSDTYIYDVYEDPGIGPRQWDGRDTIVDDAGSQDTIRVYGHGVVQTIADIEFEVVGSDLKLWFPDDGSITVSGMGSGNVVEWLEIYDSNGQKIPSGESGSDGSYRLDYVYDILSAATEYQSVRVLGTQVAVELEEYLASEFEPVDPFPTDGTGDPVAPPDPGELPDTVRRDGPPDDGNYVALEYSTFTTSESSNVRLQIRASDDVAVGTEVRWRLSAFGGNPADAEDILDIRSSDNSEGVNSLPHEGIATIKSNITGKYANIDFNFDGDNDVEPHEQFILEIIGVDNGANVLADAHFTIITLENDDFVDDDNGVDDTTPVDNPSDELPDGQHAVSEDGTTVIGKSTADTLYLTVRNLDMREGDDTIEVTDVGKLNQFFVDGGEGWDTVVITADGKNIDLGAYDIRNVEALKIVGSNTVIMAVSDIAAISGGNSLMIVDTWDDPITLELEGQAYTQTPDDWSITYNFGSVSLVTNNSTTMNFINGPDDTNPPPTSSQSFEGQLTLSVSELDDAPIEGIGGWDELIVTGDDPINLDNLDFSGVEVINFEGAGEISVKWSTFGDHSTQMLVGVWDNQVNLDMEGRSYTDTRGVDGWSRVIESEGRQLIMNDSVQLSIVGEITPTSALTPVYGSDEADEHTLAAGEHYFGGEGSDTVTSSLSVLENAAFDGEGWWDGILLDEVSNSVIDFSNLRLSNIEFVEIAGAGNEVQITASEILDVTENGDFMLTHMYDDTLAIDAEGQAVSTEAGDGGWEQLVHIGNATITTELSTNIVVTNEAVA